MTTSQVKGLLDELHGLGTRKVGFTGGEPLLREDIFDLIAHAHRRGMIIHLVTNASLLDRSNIRGLKPIETLFVSYEGPAESTGFLRPGAAEDVLDKIALARTQGINVCAMTTIVRQTIPQLQFIMDRSKKHGFPVVFSLLHRHVCAAPDLSELEPSAAEVASAIRTIIRSKRKGYQVANSYSYLRFALQWPSVKMPACYAGKLYVVIDANGDVYPCWPAMGAARPMNVIMDGVSRAIAQTRVPACGGCNFSCHQELNFLLSLHPGAVLNLLQNASRGQGTRP
jgi:MoaA/NifB/PqqE/SkfB family radical SAM enzyme